MGTSEHQHHIDAGTINAQMIVVIISVVVTTLGIILSLCIAVVIGNPMLCGRLFLVVDLVTDTCLLVL